MRKEKRAIAIWDNDLHCQLTKMVDNGEGKSVSSLGKQLIKEGLLARQRQDKTLDYIKLRKIIENAVHDETSIQTNRLLKLFQKAGTELSITFYLIQYYLYGLNKTPKSSTEYSEQFEKWNIEAKEYLRKLNDEHSIEEVIKDATNQAFTRKYRHLI
jgi:hypothetical protein